MTVVNLIKLNSRSHILLRFFFVIFACISLTHAQSLITAKQIDVFSKKHGVMASHRLMSWKTLMEKNRHLAISKKLTLVNNFFNQFQFVSDISFTGKSDYWMTPTEFIINGAGDCEDFSTAKYFTLLALGVPMDTMRIMYVKSIKLNQAHMVLTYYETPEAEPKVLDNIVSSIKPATQRPDLIPVYSFNGEGLWLNKRREQASRVGSSDNLSKWKNMLKRMNNKGHTP